MPKYKNRPLAAIIASYKTRHLPYTERKDYRHYIDSLAAELWLLKDEPWALECDENYFVYYCYVYLNPLKPGKFRYITPAGKVLYFKYEPFYVGKGKNYRSNDHLREAKDITNTSIKCHTIRKIMSAELRPIVKVMGSRVSNITACAFEIDLIACIGRRNLETGTLTNLTDGGEGGCGIRHSEESKKRRSESRMGVSLPEDWKTNISKGLKNKPKSKEHREKLRIAGLGSKRSIESSRKKSKAMRGRPWSVARRKSSKQRTPEQIAATTALRAKLRAERERP